MSAKDEIVRAAEQGTGLTLRLNRREVQELADALSEYEVVDEEQTALYQVQADVREYHDLLAANPAAMQVLAPNSFTDYADYERAMELKVSLQNRGYIETLAQSHYETMADPDTWGIMVNEKTYFIRGPGDLVNLDALNAGVGGAGGNSTEEVLASAEANGTVPTFITHPPTKN
jgi:hypothetical protein